MIKITKRLDKREKSKPYINTSMVKFMGDRFLCNGYKKQVSGYKIFVQNSD